MKDGFNADEAFEVAARNCIDRLNMSFHAGDGLLQVNNCAIREVPQKSNHKQSSFIVEIADTHLALAVVSESDRGGQDRREGQNA